MKSFISICTYRSRAVIFSLVMIVIAGMISYGSIPKESAPNVKVPVIYVSIPYEGISPEDAVNLLIKPIEKSFRTIQNVKKITSTGIESGAYIVVEFIAGIDVDVALQDIRTHVDDIMYKLPDDTKRPQIMEIDLSLEPIISLALNGNIPERTMIETARDIKYNLESLPSVLEAEIEGDREESLEIVVKPEVLESYKLSTKAVMSIINNNNRIVPAGTLHGETGEYGIKVQSVINDFKKFLEFPIKATEHSVLRLKDISDVKSTFKEPRSQARVNGESAIVLNIKKRSGSNIIETIKDVKSTMASYVANIPSQLKITYIQDHTQHIIDMISDLENSIIIGILLVMIIMIVTIGIRSSILVAFSIPASFFAGILMLDITGHTLNIVVLFSLILTVGMIVDDAIVVSEYADRKMLEGTESKYAFEIAATRMFWPIFTSTLVKIIVFLPLLFWPGVMGQFMKYMPITVIAILTSSLIFALFMQPSLGPFFGKASHASAEEINSMKASEDGNLKNLTGVSYKYANILNALLDKPKLFSLSLLSILISVYLLFIFAGTGSEFFPNVEPTSATVVVEADGNLSLSQKEDTMKACEEIINSIGKEEISVFYTSSGTFQGNGLPSDTIGTIVLEFEDWQKRRRASEILEDVRNKMDSVPGIKYQILQQRMGPPARKPIMINTSSSNAQELSDFSNKFTSYLTNLEGLIDVDSSTDKSSIEWHVNIDRDLAAMSMLDIGTIGQYVQLVGDGMRIGKYNPTDNDDQVDIILRLPKDRRTISQLKNLKIINQNNESFSIQNFANIYPAPKVSTITRVNGRTTISLTANVKDGVLVNRKLQEIKEWLNINKPSSITVTFEGDEDEQKETTTFLAKAFLSTLVLMFLIMLIQFNNFYHTAVVMSAVFLSTVGVLLGLLIFRQPFSIVMSGVGIIALGGIVLNNNIIFVDTYQHLLAQGFEKRKAIIMSGVQRFRPILLTAITAILGLLPMVLGLTIDFYTRSITYNAPSSQMWRPLAASIVGGLSFATILTLLFTPCLLILEKDKKNENTYRK